MLGISRIIVLAVMCVWLAMPIAFRGMTGQDGIPYVAVGKLVRSHPDQAYATRNGDVFDLDPRFERELCELAGWTPSCRDHAVAYVSSPQILPLTIPLSWLGAKGGVFVMRVLGAVAFVAGFRSLWKRLARRTPHAAMLLALTAVVLTPFVAFPLALGQTSPVLFLSVCLGITNRTLRGKVWRGLVWASAGLLKVFPGALFVLLVARRRRLILATGMAVVGLLSLLALCTVPWSVWGDFLATNLDFGGQAGANPYSSSPSSLIDRLLPGTQSGALWSLTIRAVTITAAAVVCWIGMRDTDDDTRWAVGYVALLIVTPLVWWHYLWVAIGALGVVLARRRALTDRTMALLPLAAVGTVVPLFAGGAGWQMPTYQSCYLIGITIVILVVVRGGSREVRSARRSVADWAGSAPPPSGSNP